MQTKFSVLPPVRDTASGFDFQWRGGVKSLASIHPNLPKLMSQHLGKRATYLCHVDLYKGSRQEMWVRPIAVIQINLTDQGEPIPNSGDISIDTRWTTLDEVFRILKEVPSGISEKCCQYLLGNQGQAFAIGEAYDVREYRLEDEVFKAKTLQRWRREPERLRGMLNQTRQHFDAEAQQH